MTPKLRLRELARKGPFLLMLKFRFPGRRRMSKSTHMTLEPRMHAGGVRGKVSKSGNGRPESRRRKLKGEAYQRRSRTS